MTQPIQLKIDFDAKVGTLMLDGVVHRIERASKATRVAIEGKIVI